MSSFETSRQVLLEFKKNEKFGECKGCIYLKNRCLIYNNITSYHTNWKNRDSESENDNVYLNVVSESENETESINDSSKKRLKFKNKTNYRNSKEENDLSKESTITKFDVSSPRGLETLWKLHRNTGEIIEDFEQRCMSVLSNERTNGYSNSRVCRKKDVATLTKIGSANCDYDVPRLKTITNADLLLPDSLGSPKRKPRAKVPKRRPRATVEQKENVKVEVPLKNRKPITVEMYGIRTTNYDYYPPEELPPLTIQVTRLSESSTDENLEEASTKEIEANRFRAHNQRKRKIDDFLLSYSVNLSSESDEIDSEINWVPPAKRVK